MKKFDPNGKRNTVLRLLLGVAIGLVIVSVWYIATRNKDIEEDHGVRGLLGAVITDINNNNALMIQMSDGKEFHNFLNDFEGDVSIYDENGAYVRIGKDYRKVNHWMSESIGYEDFDIVEDKDIKKNIDTRVKELSLEIKEMIIEMSKEMIEGEEKENTDEKDIYGFSVEFNGKKYNNATIIKNTAERAYSYSIHLFGSGDDELMISIIPNTNIRVEYRTIEAPTQEEIKNKSKG